MRWRDILLIIVAFAGIAGGVFLPGPSGLFTPAALYMMMTVLFMSFLRIDYRAFRSLDRRGLAELAFWSVVKLLALPVAAWALTAWLAPQWALAVLLLSAVSTGVTAPFFAGLLGADVTRSLQLVVVTSVIVPLSLPGLVSLLMGQELEIPFAHMARMLAMVVFAPLALAYLAKRYAPVVLTVADRAGFWISLGLFFCINLGVFAPYSDFLKSQAGDVAVALVISCLLAWSLLGLAVLAGWISGGRLEPLTGAVGLTFVNNVLVIVFSARFFGPLCPLLAAVYMLPFFAQVLPLRALARRRR